MTKYFNRNPLILEFSMAVSIDFTSTAEKVDLSLLPKEDTRYQ